jgi:hypothetical protein
VIPDMLAAVLTVGVMEVVDMARARASSLAARRASSLASRVVAEFAAAYGVPW